MYFYVDNTLLQHQRATSKHISNSKKETMAITKGGLASMLGSNAEAIALYRISLGIMLFIELVSRFQYLHPFYSDEGTLPLKLLLPKTDALYKTICIHCYSGSMIYLQLLLSVQVLLSVMLIVGYKTRLASIASWILYLSLTLRNTWLNFILDRYFHHLLFYSMFLPLDGAWTIVEAKTYKHDPRQTFISPGTIALKVLITWLYWDAGYGKYTDPLQGWTLNAKPLPALDTYVRHTVAARIVYGLLGPTGLRYMTPTVVYAEMFCAPVCLLGNLIGNKLLVYATVIGMCFIHIGIAFTMRNTVLLSLVACAAWCIFLPSGVGIDLGLRSSSESKYIAREARLQQHSVSTLIKTYGLSTLIIVAFASGSIWFEMFSEHCNQSHKHIWSTLLHNRWNVFVGAEEYVTWEIAPGQLADGSIVDVWTKSNEVSWDMPGAGAPCTSTARAGRWRSYPYLAGLQGEDGEVLWSYLCRQWNEEKRVNEVGNKGKKLLKFNFFMLQADVLPNMGFSATRKRLIHSHDCLSNASFAKNSDVNNNNGVFDFRTGEL